jgi:hypothetical protein
MRWSLIGSVAGGWLGLLGLAVTVIYLNPKLMVIFKPTLRPHDFNEQQVWAMFGALVAGYRYRRLAIAQSAT